MTRQLFLVDKLEGKNEHREREYQHPTRSGPRILTANHEVGRKKSAEEKDERGQGKSDYVGE